MPTESRLHILVCKLRFIKFIIFIRIWIKVIFQRAEKMTIQRIYKTFIYILDTFLYKLWEKGKSVRYKADKFFLKKWHRNHFIIKTHGAIKRAWLDKPTKINGRQCSSCAQWERPVAYSLSGKGVSSSSSYCKNYSSTLNKETNSSLAKYKWPLAGETEYIKLYQNLGREKCFMYQADLLFPICMCVCGWDATECTVLWLVPMSDMKTTWHNTYY